MHKFEKANFNIDHYDETENYGKFVIEPLERGFGITLGNALRRVLLSSLPGSAVYAIKVQGAIHEFSAIDGVVEDVTAMILNIKKLVFDVDSEDTATMIIDVKGPATVTGADIQCPAEVKMISNDMVIAHVAEGGHLYMELFAKKDRGYVSADQNKVNIKLLLFIREDIINQITDPDLNKIKRDGSIKLSWVDNTDDLKQIAELRFKLTGQSENDHWNRIFPNELQGKNSWDALLEHTLYKPRDILQFLCVCQELYPDNDKLTFSEMKSAIKKYSSDYFIEEMKNELSGYIDDILINSLPSTFQRLGSRSFTFEKFMQVINEQSNSKTYKEQDVRQLVLILFESGYVGQLINGSFGKTSVVFKYRNPSAMIDYNEKMIIHRGIQKGLSIVL